MEVKMCNPKKFLGLTLLVVIFLSGVGLVLVQDLLASEQNAPKNRQGEISYTGTKLAVRNTEIFDWFGYSPSSGKRLYSVLL